MIRRVSAVLSIAASLFGAEFRYREALPGYQYRFPADHFAHPDFRTEWWYYTGNVTDFTGHRYGFELVFFRQAEHRGESPNHSAWRVDDAYAAHSAVTDIDGKKFYYSERINRAGPGIAGVDAERSEVWNGNWRVKWTGDRQRLSAVADDFHFDLQADPQTPIVIHGVGGVSQKADRPGQASHYISFPLMNVNGTLKIGGQEHTVRGTAWMDQEWFSEDIDPNLQGWDWLSVQLADRTELMLYDFRRKDGSIDPHSSGTYVDASGNARHLISKDFSLRPVRFWGKYPVKWRIEVPSLKIALDCEAALENQELKTRGRNYWEGAVAYSGSRAGVGYLEMTGYDKPISFN